MIGLARSMNMLPGITFMDQSLSKLKNISFSQILQIQITGRVTATYMQRSALYS